MAETYASKLDQINFSNYVKDDKKHYIVTLKDEKDLDQFYTEMETPTVGLMSVPDREVELIRRRPTSLNTEYWLTDAEVEKLNQDPRVVAVEMPAAARGMKPILFDAMHPMEEYITPDIQSVQDTSALNFDKSTTNASNMVNWGLLRCTNTSNLTNFGSDGTPSISQPLTISPTGNGVDVIIVDGGDYGNAVGKGSVPDANHPEYLQNAVSPQGPSRMVRYNWFQLDSALGRTDNTQTDYVYFVNNSTGHCWHTSATTAGNRQGWARDAAIYNLDFLYRAGSPDDITEWIFDYLRAFHTAKKSAGNNRPTISNNSWGYGMLGTYPEAYASEVTYRGTLKSGGLGNDPTLGYRMGYHGVINNRTFLGHINGYTNPLKGVRVTTTSTSSTNADIPYVRFGPAASLTSVTLNSTNPSTYITLPFNINFGGTSQSRIGVHGEWWLSFGAWVRESTATGVRSYWSQTKFSPDTPKLGFGVFKSLGSVTWIKNVYHGLIDSTAGKRRYLIRLEGFRGNGPNDTLTPNSFFEFTFYEEFPARIDIQTEANDAFTRQEPASPGFDQSELHEYGFATWAGSVPVRSAALDSDYINSIAAGVINVAAAGNSYYKISVPGEADWNNTFNIRLWDATTSTWQNILTYYHRGSSPGANDTSIGLNNICVGALSANKNESKATFSNCGPGIDIWAPGENIMSAVGSNDLAYLSAPTTDPRDSAFKMQKYNGTSMACPQITGMLACMLELNPTWNQAQAKSWLINNARGGLMYSGTGGTTDVTDIQGAPNRIAYFPNATNPVVPVTVYLDVSPISSTEGSGVGLVYNFVRTGATVSSLTINYAITGTATLGTDYSISGTGTGTSRSITIPAGSTSAAVTVTPLADATTEGNETVIFTITSGTGYAIGTTSGVVSTITESTTPIKPRISLSVSPASVQENSGTPMVFVFTRTGSTANSLNVSYSLSGTATPGSDFTASPSATTGNNSITIPAGQLVGLLTITPIGDTTPEANETVGITINASASYDIETLDYVAATIINDDAVGTPVVTISTYGGAVAEDTSNLSGMQSFTFYRTGVMTNPLTINWTLSGTATKGVDYNVYDDTVPSNGPRTITIPAGSSYALWSVNRVADGDIESDETIIATIDANPNYIIGSPSTGTLTILNDDVVGGKPSVSVQSANVVYENTKIPQIVGAPKFTFTRTGVTSTPLTILYTLSGTATAGIDYVIPPNSGTFVIPAGQQTAELVLELVDDHIWETNETITLTITADPAYTILRGTGTMTIWNTEDSSSSTDTHCTVTQSSYYITEGGAGATVTFTIDKTSTTDTNIYFDTSGATYGTDWTATFRMTGVTGIATIPAGQLSVSYSISALNNTAANTPRILQFTLGSYTGLVMLTDFLLMQIVDSGYTPATVTVNVSPASVLEDGTTDLQYTFTRTGSTASTLLVKYIIDGDAISENDFTGLPYGTPKTITFGAGQSTALLTIHPKADTVNEPNETLTVKIITAEGYVPGVPDSATGTISNDDSGTPTGSVVTMSCDASFLNINEDAGKAPIVVFSRTGSTAAALSVNFTVGGTATPGTDYTGITSLGAKTISIPAGAADARITLRTVTDTVVEPDETIIITLDAGTGYTVGTSQPVTIKILNDDGAGTLPVVSVGVSNPSILEDAAGTVSFTFTRTGATTNPLTVNYTVSGTATPGTDYTGIASLGAKTITIPAGSTATTLIVDPTPDTLVELDETVIITVNTGTGYNVGTSSATLTITNDDGVSTTPSVSISATPVSITEDGSATAVFTFARTGATTSPLTVNYTVGGTATPGTDYIGFSAIGASTIVIPAGSASVAVTVDPTPDTTVEADETVIVTINSGTGYTIGGASATVTITNDDVAPTIPVVTVSVNPSSADEAGVINPIFTFTRTGATTAALTVNYTVGGTAQPGIDYTGMTSAGAKTITFPIGSTLATVMIDPTPDTVTEGNETVIFTVNAGTGYNVGTPSSATATLTETPAQTGPTVTVATMGPAPNNTVIEDSIGQIYFQFSRTGSTASPLTVYFSMSGTATRDTDYTVVGSTTPSSLEIPAGSASASFAIHPIADSIIEPDETVIVTVSPNAAYVVGTPSVATGTILNDDVVSAKPTVSLLRGSNVTEDGIATIPFYFSRTGLTTNALTVLYSISGTATPGTDYVSIPTSVIIPAGQSQATIYVDPIADTVVEPNETVTLTITASTNYNIDATYGTATATIINDDTTVTRPTVTLSVSPASVTEASGTPLSFRFTRTGATTASQLVVFNVAGTATAGTDYTGINTGFNSVTIPAGASFVTINVTPLTDALVEGNETVEFQMIQVTDYISSPLTPVVGTITNSTAPTTTPMLTLSMTSGQVLGSNWANYYLSQPSNWHYSDNSYMYIGASNYGYEMVSPNRTNFGSMSPVTISRNGKNEGVRQVMWGATSTSSSEWLYKLSGSAGFTYPADASVTITITGNLSGITRSYTATSYYSYTTANSNGDYVRTWVFANPNNWRPANASSFTVNIQMSV